MIYIIDSYIVSIGMIDKLSLFMSNIRAPIDEMPELADFLKDLVLLLTAITNVLSLRCDNTGAFGVRLTDDDTQFMMTLRMTHICGVISLLYGLLLHSGAPVRTDDTPPIVSNHVMELAFESIRFINHVSLLDLNMIQVLIVTQ